ncbi:MAG: hypothetical protein KAS32_16485 [Candidatus Peribacteraceae bacterium]|nr:hypothetical protein [Candidatus Peribacteraceae bacterium]
MTRLIDLKCNSCDHLWETIHIDDDGYGKCPKCDSGNVARVFTKGSVQFQPNKASCVEHVLKHNAKKREEQYEEDSAVGSDAMKELEAVTEYVEAGELHTHCECDECTG